MRWFFRRRGFEAPNGSIRKRGGKNFGIAYTSIWVRGGHSFVSELNRDRKRKSDSEFSLQIGPLVAQIERRVHSNDCIAIRMEPFGAIHRRSSYSGDLSYAVDAKMIGPKRPVEMTENRHRVQVHDQLRSQSKNASACCKIDSAPKNPLTSQSCSTTVRLTQAQSE